MHLIEEALTSHSVAKSPIMRTVFKSSRPVLSFFILAIKIQLDERFCYLLGCASSPRGARGRETTFQFEAAAASRGEAESVTRHTTGGGVTTVVGSVTTRVGARSKASCHDVTAPELANFSDSQATECQNAFFVRGPPGLLQCNKCFLDMHSNCMQAVCQALTPEPSTFTQILTTDHCAHRI